MKHFFTLINCLSVMLFLSCGGGGEYKKPAKENAISTTCYLSVYENDTARMELSYLDSTRVRGKLHIAYANHNVNNGTVKGAFKGDTLFVDYVFWLANSDLGSFTNPLAFVKKGDQLIMGVGQIETTLGRSYFVKGKPINFERAKFVFEPVACAH